MWHGCRQAAECAYPANQRNEYWVVATTDAQQTGLDSNWYGSNNSQVAFNTGDGWQHVTGGTPAFMVEGSGIGLSQTLTDASHRAFGSNLFVDPCTRLQLLCTR